MPNKNIVTSDPWQEMRQLTSARIALGRAGGSLPTAPMLAFQLAHARARDAVRLPFDAAAIATRLAQSGLESLRVRSAVASREEFLRRPDLGRRLDAPSRGLLLSRAESVPRDHDAVFVIGDGLSALAVHCHALGVLALAHNALRELGWRLAPVVVAAQARVALGDEIGEILRAAQVAVLIGERPGLSCADSLGIYLTHAPRVGRSDAERNCISNIRPAGGLSYVQAAHRLVYLMTEARRRKLTGVALKDASDDVPLLVQTPDPD